MRKIVILAVILGLVLFFQPVLASPGITVTVEVVDKQAGGADLSAEYNVKVTSITDVPENVDLSIRPAEPSELIGAEEPAVISWFDWSSKPTFSLAAWDTVEFSLYVNLPAGVSAGEYRFVAVGGAIDPDDPLALAEDADSQEIIVVSEETIPEFTTIAIPVAAIFGLILLIRGRKQK
jgi:hypothetical protein